MKGRLSTPRTLGVTRRHDGQFDAIARRAEHPRHDQHCQHRDGQHPPGADEVASELAQPTGHPR